MNITSALLAVQDFQTFTTRIALDDLLVQQAIAASAVEQLLKDQAIVTAALAEHAQTWRSAMDLVATCRPLYVELAAMAAMPEPSLFERHMPEAFCLPTVSPRRFEPDFEDEPNRRTGARKEVITKIGFIR